MGDIVLVEGLNELNVEMTPLAAQVALFVYASDVRQTPYTRPGGWEGVKYEVDIQNVGGVAGSCTAVGWVDCTLQYNTFGMGIDFINPRSGTPQVINPGQVVTFKGQWEWQSPTEDDWWFKDSGYIRSEAGCISFKFGRSVYPVSLDIPSQIPSGGEFWPTQVVHLAGGGVRPGSLPPNATPNLEGDLFRVILCLRPPRYSGQVPSIEQGDIVSRCDINALHYVTQVLPDGGQLPMGDMQLLTTYSDYTVKGTYEMQILVPHNGGGVVVSVNVPCKASYWTGGAGAINRYLPMPPGTYDVVSFLGWSYQQTGYGPWHVRVIWCYIVGQVQVI